MSQHDIEKHNIFEILHYYTHCIYMSNYILSHYMANYILLEWTIVHFEVFEKWFRRGHCHMYTRYSLGKFALRSGLRRGLCLPAPGGPPGPGAKLVIHGIAARAADGRAEKRASEEKKRLSSRKAAGAGPATLRELPRGAPDLGRRMKQ